MPNAKIITSNPESTESLAAYLRAQGYEVSYSQPGYPHTLAQSTHPDDLVIAVESCVDPRQALARARELAASRRCDVFVGEGVFDGRLDLPEPVEQLDIREVAAASLPAEPCSSAAPSEAADFEASTPEPVSQITAKVPPEVASQPTPSPSILPAFGDTAFESREPRASQEKPVASLRENAPVAATRKPSAMKLGWRALQEAKRLVAMHWAVLLERTRGMLQLVKARTSEQLEALLLWQQYRSAVLARRREEQRKSREQLRQRAAVKREATQQGFARRWQQIAEKPKETAAQTIAQRIRTIQAGLHLSKTRSATAASSNITPIQSAKSPESRRYSRDWKMVFTGAGVAALLMLFVLGVFSGHRPATDHPRAEAAAPQLPLRTVALTPAVSRAQTVPPLVIASAPAPSMRASAVPNTRPVAAPGAKPEQTNYGGSGKTEVVASRKSASRTILEEPDSEPEVVVRYFHRASKRTSVAKTVAGIKHYSDQN